MLAFYPKPRLAALILVAFKLFPGVHIPPEKIMHD